MLANFYFQRFVAQHAARQFDRLFGDVVVKLNVWRKVNRRIDDQWFCADSGSLMIGSGMTGDLLERCGRFRLYPWMAVLQRSV